MKTCMWLCCLLALSLASAQPYPQDYFRSPLDVPLVLSGTFGELRSNHFHGGIDLKTQGVEGLPVYAAAEGYISRIKVAAGGYGLALYVDHPNGYTTVYGHLQQSSPDIMRYTEEVQYRLTSFEVDIYPEPGRLPVAKGDRIALSGNSGSSGGPHLHFEVRETKSEVPINPLLFGFSVRDNVPPEAATLYLYEKLPGLITPVRKTMNLVKRNGVYVPETGQDTLLVSGQQVAFGLYAYDRTSDAANRNGLYDLMLQVDGKLLFRFTAEKIPFSETRYLNALIDYCLSKEKRRRIYTCYRKPGNFLSAYQEMQNNGWHILTSREPIPVEMTLKDVSGNTSTVQLWLRWTGAQSANQVLGTGHYLYPDRQQTIQRKGLTLTIPAWSLYDTIPESIAITEEAGQPIYRIQDACVPLQYPIDGTFALQDISASYSSKLVALWQEGDSRQAYTGIVQDSSFHVSLPFFGSYVLALDTTPPVITVIRKPTTNGKAIFRLRDDLSGVKHYSGTINGRWILMAYDAKTGTLSGTIPKWESGEQYFRLTVTDAVGNQLYYTLNWILP